MDQQAERRAGVRGRTMLLAVVAVAVLLAGGSLFGSAVCGAWARRMAERRLAVWALSDALVWLDRADRFQPENATNQLLRARCYRYLGQTRRRERALQLAAQYGAPQQQVEHERLLGRIQSGELYQESLQYVTALSDGGADSNDLASVYVEGSLVRQQFDAAEAMLNGWATDFPDQAQTSYMKGRFWEQVRQFERARECYQQALSLAPRHELAGAAIAALWNRQQRPEEAFQQYTVLAGQYPRNDSILVELSKLLRARGRWNAARDLLAQLAADPQPTSRVALEMGQIELESGQYPQAVAWLAQVSDRELTESEGLMASALALTYVGDLNRGRMAMDRVEREATAITRMQDLKTRLTFDAQDREAMTEQQQLIQWMSASLMEGSPLTVELPRAGRDEVPGMALYREQCAACHGDSGGGDGRAARHVFPRPRDLRRGKTRLVSTDNGVPTREDIVRVLKAGMPGTAMMAFDQLTATQLEQLADIVLRIRRDGLRDELRRRAELAEDEIDDEELQEIVEDRTRPGRGVAVASLGADDPGAVARGKELFTSQTCASCHGTTGEGSEDLPLFDDEGFPVSPRNLVSDPMKGGDQQDAIYLRVLLGMPGSPHPANVAPQQALSDLAHYCQSLVRPPLRVTTNHERAIEAYSRPLVEQ